MPGSMPRNAKPVTPSDTVDLPMIGTLYVGVSGDVAVTLDGDSTINATKPSVVFKDHPVGYLPCIVKRVWATGTTATNLIVLN